MKIGQEDPTNQMALVSRFAFFFLQCTGRDTHVHPVVSSEVENIVCSQPSTCLTCWPWCYSVQPCHRMTSLTHCGLSSLPLQPTLLLLTHRHKFCLTVRVCYPSVRSPRSVLLFTFLQLSLVQGLYFFFSLSSLAFLLIQSPFLSLSISRSSASFPRPTPVGLGGQQALTVVLAVDCEVTCAQPHWDSTALSEPQKQRQRKMRG